MGSHMIFYLFLAVDETNHNQLRKIKVVLTGLREKYVEKISLKSRKNMEKDSVYIVISVYCKTQTKIAYRF